MPFSLPKSLGNTQSWQKETYGLSGVTDHGRWRVMIFDARIARISITLDPSFEDFSYAVIVEPLPVSFKAHELSDAIWLETESFHLKIEKSPTRFTFLTPEHQVINADDSGLGTAWNGEQVTTYKALQKKERFIGLGEKTGALDKTGAGYTNWNTDNFGYSSGADPLYCTTPFYIGLHNQLMYGLFFDNSNKSYFNFGASNNRFSSFAADTGEMDYYFIYANSVAEILRSYSFLTGRMPMPPLWSLGYQQCRYSYYPDKEVLSVAHTFREKNIPADTIVLDIHYMDKYKIFSWDPERFTDPAKTIQSLKDMGFHVVVICDPGIKVEQGYAAYDEGIDQDIFIKYPDGGRYAGQVWPGWCHFPDFTNSKARNWWGAHFKDYVNKGVEGFWNDMNEIATWGNMLPENIVLDLEGNRCSMRKGRNLYGMQMARSTYEGTKSLMSKRPFVLTRSGYSGVQRYAAVWTGDNVAYDEHMMLGIRMVSNLGLAGIPFAGYDVGGFVGDAGIKLFARWFSIASFSPFFRGHTMINSRDAEPWTYGEEVEQICRNYASFRYMVMPYLYAVFHEAAETGMPVQRTLAIDYPFEPAVYERQFHHQYLLGPFILVAPVESQHEITKVYLPEGTWYSLYDCKRLQGNQEVLVECPLSRLPVFIKEGAIIPMQRPGQHTGEKSPEFEVHIYKTNKLSQFYYYTDDGESYDYESDGFYARSMELTSQKLILGKRNGRLKPSHNSWTLVFHGFDPIAEVKVNGKSNNLQHRKNVFFPALEKFDPVYDPEPVPEELVQTVSFELSDVEMVVSW